VCRGWSDGRDDALYCLYVYIIEGRVNVGPGGVPNIPSESHFQDHRAISNTSDMADYAYLMKCIEELRVACYAKLDSNISLEPALSSLTLHLTKSRAALASSAELCPRSAVRSWMNMPSFSFTLSISLSSE